MATQLRFPGPAFRMGSVGAVLLVVERVIQGAPSAVETAAVKARMPAPALRMATNCESGAAPLVTMEKVSWPGSWSKKAAEGAATVRVTGTTCESVPSAETAMISAE